MDGYQFLLPKDFATKWLKALRSGEYEQGKSYLYSYSYNGATAKDKYCCLGVACAVNGIEKSELRKEFIPKEFQMPDRLKGDRANNILVKFLTDMNDGTIEKLQKDSKNFTEIANWIEENVEFI